MILAVKYYLNIYKMFKNIFENIKNLFLNKNLILIILLQQLYNSYILIINY